MEWTKRISPGALRGVTQESRCYVEHILTVSRCQNLDDALAEFVRRLLIEARLNQAPGWDVVLFELWMDVGQIVVVFTTSSLECIEDPIFVLESELIAEDYGALSRVTDDAARFKSDHERMRRRLQNRIETALLASPARELLNEVRSRQPMRICITLCAFKEEIVDLAV